MPTCVRPLVGFKVGAFRVDLLTAFEIAFVNLAPAQAVGEVAQRSGRRRRRRVGRRVAQRAQTVVGRRSVRWTDRRRRQRPLAQRPAVNNAKNSNDNI